MGCKKSCWVVEKKTSRLEEELIEREQGLINEDFDINLDYLIDEQTLSTKLTIKDYIDSFKARFIPSRSSLRIKPGLYKVGDPNQDSDVLVSSNYKLTFDSLRKELTGLNIWLLILNTHGVNVWCAAGKGTFSTAELLYRYKKHKVSDFVNHNKVIIPQLGAPGINIVEAKKYGKLDVVVGPVRASDIKTFIENKYLATKEQRTVSFNLKDRMTLIPIEVANSLKLLLLISGLSIILCFLSNGTTDNLLNSSLVVANPYLIAYFLAIVVFPILLPYIPFKAFYLKGILLSLIANFYLIYGYQGASIGQFMGLIGQIMMITIMVSSLCLNFTGSTTFTSYSGVLKETGVMTKYFKKTVVIAAILIFISIII